MSYSDWLKTDLHIHSIISNQTKNNDYTGKDYNANELLKKLIENGVKLFSVTDHNIINVDLYKEIEDLVQNDYKNKINYLIGIEIDVKDEDINNYDIFHMLVYFDTKNIANVEKVICQLYNKKNISEIGKNEIIPDLSTLFKNCFQYDIENIITIPHFNDKDKGLPTDDSIDSFVYTVFSALEDSNNRDNLKKSIKAFEKHEYVDVPLVVFSDNHNLNIYPKGKCEDKNHQQTEMFLLGNVNHPFSSVKTAFQDVKTRVYIKDVTRRDSSHVTEYIKEIIIDDYVINLSPYQNTIIGGFGTGKSFLLNLIQNGINGVDKGKYSELKKNYDNFLIKLTDDIPRKSLEETINTIKLIRFDQEKEIYFSSTIDENCKDDLQMKLGITFPKLEAILKKDEQSLIDAFNEYIELSEKNITDKLNYRILSEINSKDYTIKSENTISIYEEKDYLDYLYTKLEFEQKSVLFEKPLYTIQEIQDIGLTSSLIKDKNTNAIIIKKNLEYYMNKIDSRIIETNRKVTKKNQSLSANICISKEIKKYLRDYAISLKNLKKMCEQFEKTYSEEKFKTLANTQIENIIDDSEFKVRCMYNQKIEYPSYKYKVLKSEFRSYSFFIGIIKTTNNSSLFSGNKSFEDNLKSYLDTYYSNFIKLEYDLLEGDDSLKHKSAGERANLIMRVIFKQVETDVKNDTPVVVIIDQPEDSLDNKGITKEVVNKIRNMKINNTLPQIICVTHNANISIMADSENIIVARKEDGKCYYASSGIEDVKFIDDVCNIVEGGSIALKKRGEKFNIPFIKKINEE